MSFSASEERRPASLLDYVLYTLASAVIAAVSFSFLLWLRN